jgi:hypothetical protein
VAAVGKDAWIRVEVNLGVRLHLEQIHNGVLDVILGALLAEPGIGASFAADRWAWLVSMMIALGRWAHPKSLTLVAALELCLATFRTREPVTRGSAWHGAPRVRTLGGARLLGARSARLATLLAALRVAALDIARPFTWLARLLAMTLLAALVVTCRVRSTTDVFALSMVGSLNLVVLSKVAHEALLLAGVSAWKRCVARRSTHEGLVVDASAAFDADLVSAARNPAPHLNLAHELVRVLCVPASGIGDDMTTLELEIEIGKLGAALFLACISAGPRARMIAALLGPNTRLQASDSAM